MLSFEQALAQMLAQTRPPVATETLPLEAARNRVLAQDVTSPMNVPAFDNSAMDGYAVRCGDLAAPGVTLPVSQRIAAGMAGQPLQAGTAARIFTGAPIPPGADAVVMQEDCQQDGDLATFRIAPRPGDHIRRIGEDVAQGSVVLAQGVRLNAQQLGLAAAVGCAELTVFRPLKVALFFTGNEIVAPGQPLAPGQIYNANRYGVAALLEALGCTVVDLGVVADNRQATLAALRQAASAADIVLTCGGVSVGEEDHVKAAVEQLGSVDLWKVAIKPGKPLAFGEVCGKPFIGLPGNPVSALVVFSFFVRPYLLRSQGVRDVTPPSFTVRAGFDWRKPSVRREWLRARLDGDRAVLFPNQSSGVLTSLTWAEGIVVVPEHSTVNAGDSLRYFPFTGLGLA